MNNFGDDDEQFARIAKQFRAKELAEEERKHQALAKAIADEFERRGFFKKENTQ